MLAVRRHVISRSQWSRCLFCDTFNILNKFICFRTPHMSGIIQNKVITNRILSDNCVILKSKLKARYSLNNDENDGRYALDCAAIPDSRNRVVSAQTSVHDRLEWFSWRGNIRITYSQTLSTQTPLVATYPVCLSLPVFSRRLRSAAAGSVGRPRLLLLLLLSGMPWGLPASDASRRQTYNAAERNHHSRYDKRNYVGLSRFQQSSYRTTQHRTRREQVSGLTPGCFTVI